MSFVATLISAPGGPALGEAMFARVLSRLPAAEPPAWLAEGIAADILLPGLVQLDCRRTADTIRDALGGAPVDVVVQPLAHRRKRLFLADMDSTMIEQECIDELADYVGLKPHVAAITERAMRGEIAFAPALRERVARLKGLPATVVDDVIAKHITLTPGATALVKTMRAHGTHTCLVTGGFTLFSQRVAAMIGFDESHANTLAIGQDGKLTGDVVEPIFGSDGKLATLRALTARLGLDPEQTLATGDGANDIAMIEAAGLGVAFHAKPKVAETAAARIDHGDLTALLYLQGYRRVDFAMD
jgi:phosphoserine phosphatase